MPVADAVALIFPMLLVGDWFALGAHWRKWDLSLYGRAIPLAVIGVFLGTFVLVTSPPLVLKRGLGIAVLLLAIYKLLEPRLIGRLEYQPKSWHGVFAGGVSGFGAALAHTGGPPIVLYFLLVRVSPAIYASTLVLFFATLNLVKLPTYIIAGVSNLEQIIQLVWIFPLIPIGVWFGKWLNKRTDPKVFQRIILVFMFVASGALLFT